MSDRSPADLARGVIDAINSRDGERLRGLLDPEVEVATGRTVHRGPDAVVAWAGKEYDHLVRRYAVDELREGKAGREILALGSVQYAWSEDAPEDVADSSPIALSLAFVGERLRRLELHDDTAAALIAFEG